MNLAQKLKISETKLKEVIEKYTNNAVKVYLQKLKIIRFVEMVENSTELTKYKETLLAKEAGFSKVEEFKFQFKNITGVSLKRFIEFLEKKKSRA